MKKIITAILYSAAVIAVSLFLVIASIYAVENEGKFRETQKLHYLHEQYKENPDRTIQNILDTYGDEAYEFGYLKPEIADFIRNVANYEE